MLQGRVGIAMSNVTYVCRYTTYYCIHMYVHTYIRTYVVIEFIPEYHNYVKFPRMLCNVCTSDFYSKLGAILLCSFHVVSMVAEEGGQSASQPARSGSPPGKGTEKTPDTTSGGGETPSSEGSGPPDKVQTVL